MSPLPVPARRIAERLDRYTRQPGGLSALNGDQVVQILRHVRRLIEADNLASNYPHAKLYGDWLQHNNLNNAVALSLLEAVNIRFIEDAPLELAVPTLIGLVELRRELGDLFLAYGLSDNLFQTGTLWMRFAGLLLEEIIEVPIFFPESTGSQSKVSQIRQKIWDAAIAAAGSDPGSAAPLWFDRLSIELDEATDDFRWRLEFVLPTGERWGVRGRLYFTDNLAFRDNDLGLRTGDEAAMMKAVHQVVAERPADRIFPISGPAEPEQDA